jgi:hypothetical protein
MWIELHYILCIVCYAIAGTLSALYVWRHNTDILQCREGLSIAPVTPIYQIVMFCEFVDLILVSFVYFVLDKFPRAHYYPLVVHHVIVITSFWINYTLGSPDSFALISAMNIFVPFWYVYRLYPNSTTYAIRATAVAYGRLLVLSSGVLITTQHFFCMDGMKAKLSNGGILLLLAVFIAYVEIPMFKAATVPFDKGKF